MLRDRILKLVVLVAAFGAVAAGTATAAKLITGKQVKNRSLTGKDVKLGSLGPGTLSAAAKATLTGPKGADGAPGATGPAGPAGPSDVYTHRRAEAAVSALQRTAATQTLPAGLYQVTASLNIVAFTGGKTQTCSLRSGEKDFASATYAAGDGERMALTIAGAVTIPEGADGQVSVRCVVDGDSASVTNLSIVSTRATKAVVTDE